MSREFAEALAPVEQRALPAPGSGLTRGRRLAGMALVVLGLPMLTGVLVDLRGSLEMSSTLLIYLLAVVTVAVVGGIVPAVSAAAASYFLANWFLTPPYNTLLVASRDSVVELLVFVVAATAVAVTVEVGARRRVAAVRSDVEAALLSGVTGTSMARMSPEDVLEQVRTLFGMATVALVEERDGQARDVVRSGAPSTAQPQIHVPAGPGLELVGHGRHLVAEDRRLLATLAQAAASAVEGRRLADEAARARELDAVDRLRSALLAAVSHELRTPLAGAKAAVSSLRQRDIEWTGEEREDLLATVEEAIDRLGDLIANVLDLSRLQAGALSVEVAPVALDEVVGRALVQSPHGSAIVNLVPEKLPPVLADAGLLERVLANLLDNAGRFAPADDPVQVTAEPRGTVVALRVVDRGPGVPTERWDRMFVPFQRLDDRSGDGLGLGLAIAQGFTEAMGGSLAPSHTAGGGLTMTLTLPVAA